MIVGGSAANLCTVAIPTTIPSTVIWAYSVGGAVFVIGLIMMFVRGDWKRARRLDKLVLFGPLFYLASIAAFGTEHFTLTKAIASIVPAWIPWHTFWAYFVGTCFILAAFSIILRIWAHVPASLLALTFFLFAMLMDLPGWLQQPHNRFAVTFMLRELSFSGGALALAASLIGIEQKRGARIAAIVARYFVAIPVLFFSAEQFLHGRYVPGIPLEPLTPVWIVGHAVWTYLAAAVYAVAGILLVSGIRTHAAASWLGLTVLFVELVVYVPMGVVYRASLNNGLNYVMDTLMFCGAVLLLAGAMPHEKARRELMAASPRTQVQTGA